MENSKEKLLNTNLFLDNVFFDKYINLIISNRYTEKQIYKTQKHHIIPKYYYKSNNLKIDNSSNNVVNLLYKDHMLAHYYMCLCSSEDKFKYKNFVAIRFILNNTNYSIQDFYNNEKLFIESLDKYQELYEFSRKKFGEISKLKNTGKVRTKEQIENYRRSKLGIKKSKEHCNNISKVKSGYMWVNKNNISKQVYEKDLDIFLKDGWKLGRGKFTDKHALNISKSKKGMKRSIDSRKKQSETTKGHKGRNIGMHWYTNGVDNVMCNEDSIPDGFYRGRKI